MKVDIQIKAKNNELRVTYLFIWVRLGKPKYGRFFQSSLNELSGFRPVGCQMGSMAFNQFQPSFVFYFKGGLVYYNHTPTFRTYT